MYTSILKHFICNKNIYQNFSMKTILIKYNLILQTTVTLKVCIIDLLINTYGN